ncbi:MAG: ABC transporter ATP-binding protein [Anaerolineae bacterium]|nr:ABC transporter ATP-binding protein [Anaerolineae bacterium]
MPSLSLRNLNKRFGKAVAVENLDLEIHDGEIMTMLGPSGCGKTTTLRCIAGLLRPDSGEIYLGDKRITDTSPEKRGVGLVFQNYALWPHMTVHQNLAFGLQLRKVPKEKAARRIDEALAMVRLSGFEERYPRQLSGGQQQRVALARALVIEPSLLLLDEPLSNLDAQLREEMRFEIRELQKKLGITSVYVTHDQAEALVLSDRIAILHEGRLVQVGTPEEIYNQPGNRFVAGFIGLTSFVEGRVASVDDAGAYATVRTEDNLEIQAAASGLQPGQKVTLAIRPEHIEIGEQEPVPSVAGTNLFQGQVLRGAYLGDIIDYRIGVGNWVLRANTPTDRMLQPGQQVWLSFAPDRVTWIPA